MKHLRYDPNHIQRKQEHPNNIKFPDNYFKFNPTKNSYCQQTKAKKDKPTDQDTNQKKKNKQKGIYK